MWRDTARDFAIVPNSLLPMFAPLSLSMVEHLMLIEYQPYRRAVVSSWPPREKVWQRVLKRVTEVRNDVCEYMDTFVKDDIKKAEEEGRERSFPNDEWLIEHLEAYASVDVKVSKKALEDWQGRNILRRECPPGGRWNLDDIATILIMRIVDVTRQKGWLPSEIPPDEPRWWTFGKAAPDVPVQAVSTPLQGGEDGPPLLLWTPYIGASWDSRWQRHHGISVRWSRHFKDADEISVWHNEYAKEIRWIFGRGSLVSSTELRLSREGILMPRDAVQTVIRASIERIMKDVEQALLREAEHLILEEQALLISKEK